MSSVVFNTLVVGSVFFAAWLFTSRADVRLREGLPYPPGPSRLPVIGNLFDMPSAYEWIIFRDWGRKYGALLSALSVSNRIDDEVHRLGYCACRNTRDTSRRRELGQGRKRAVRQALDAIL